MTTNHPNNDSPRDDGEDLGESSAPGASPPVWSPTAGSRTEPGPDAITSGHPVPAVDFETGYVDHGAIADSASEGGGMAEPQEDSPAKGVLAPKTAPTEQPPPAYVPPKPATWKVIQPSEPWCPSELVDKLGFEVDYQNDYYVPRMFLSGPWSVTGATRRGRMHAHQGSFREDAMAFRTDSCFSLFCVCDGAGSSSYSRVGSELTARKYCKIVGDQLKKVESVLRGLSRDELHKQLRRMMLFSMVGADHYTESPSLSIPQLVQMMARALKVEPKEFRCTILTVLLYHHHDGDVFLFGNVGDGFMAALKKNGEAIRIGGSHSGSYSGEVVCFVPDPGVNSYYQSSIEKIAPLPAEEVEAVLICTDGVEDPFFPIDKNIGDMFSQLKDGFHKPVGDVTYPEGCEPKSIVGAPNPGSELLRWLGYEKRGENDDRTAVLIYRNSLAIT